MAFNLMKEEFSRTSLIVKFINFYGAELEIFLFSVLFIYLFIFCFFFLITPYTESTKAKKTDSLLKTGPKRFFSFSPSLPPFPLLILSSPQTNIGKETNSPSSFLEQPPC